MSDMFDYTAFLDQSTETASERRPPVPALEYLATITDVGMKPWQSKDKYNEDGTLKSGVMLEVTTELQLPQEVQDMCKITKLTLMDRPMLDLLPDRSGIDYGLGKNGRLRMYREATGMNVAGQAFSPRMLIGRLIRVRVTHEEYQGNLQERIGGIAKAQ
mgnify:CR=1 FL=1